MDCDDLALNLLVSLEMGHLMFCAAPGPSPSRNSTFAHTMRYLGEKRRNTLRRVLHA